MKHKLLGLLVFVALMTTSFIPGFTVAGAVEDSFFEPTQVFKATIRDFTPTTHPDFQNTAFYNAARNVGFAPTEGLVADTLDSDKKPVFAGIPRHMITDKDSFSQWYRDVPGVNTSISYDLVLNHIGSGVYRYENTDFFPIDNRGFGNYGFTNRNYHFTTEIQSKFVYNGGEIFEFNGDDDLWVFIDNRLVIDIGGIHGATKKQINIDDIADELGLLKGRIYDFRLFHAERQTTQSTFSIYTSIAFSDQDDYEMSISAKTAGGEYSNNILGYIGQKVELEYRIPAQKVNLPEGDIEIFSLTSIFQSTLPPGIEVTETSLKLSKPDGKTMLTGTDYPDYGFKIGRDPITGDYRVEELVIVVVGRLVETGTHCLDSEDTSLKYTLNYSCDSILGQKIGKFKVTSNVEIKVNPFEVTITGPDSIMLGQRNEYTATLSVEGINNPVFEWSTEANNSIEIIEQKNLNGKSTVIIKGNKLGLSKLKVSAYSGDYDKYKANATKDIAIKWTVDIN